MADYFNDSTDSSVSPWSSIGGGGGNGPHNFSPLYSMTEPISTDLARKIIRESATNVGMWIQRNVSSSPEGFLREHLPELADVHEKWAVGGAFRGRLDEAWSYLGYRPLRENVWNEGYVPLRALDMLNKFERYWLEANCLEIFQNAVGQFALRYKKSKRTGISRADLLSYLKDPNRLSRRS